MIKNGGGDRDGSEDDCGNQRWTLKPAVACESNKGDREDKTDCVVGDPSYRALLRSSVEQIQCWCLKVPSGMHRSERPTRQWIERP